MLIFAMEKICPPPLVKSTPCQIPLSFFNEFWRLAQARVQGGAPLLEIEKKGHQSQF